MKKILLKTLLVLSTLTGFAQENGFKSNSIFLEAGGAALVHSVNYERVLLTNEQQNLGLIAGIGFSPALNWFERFEFDPLIPVRLKLFSQQNNFGLEVGFALTPYIEDPKNIGDFFTEAEVAIFGEFGFRFLLFEQRHFVGITFTPILNEIDTPELDRIGPMPWAALKAGYRF